MQKMELSLANQTYIHFIQKQLWQRIYKENKNKNKNNTKKQNTFFLFPTFSLNPFFGF